MTSIDDAVVRDGLRGFLAERLGDDTVEVLGLELSSAGARRVNAAFTITCSSGESRLVLTLLPFASLEINTIRAEAEIRSLARDHGVLAPAVVGVCDDDRRIGWPFMVSEFQAGETIPRRVVRLVQAEGLGDEVGRSLATALAKLHRIPPEQAPEALWRLDDPNPAAGALRTLEEQAATLLEPRPAISWGIRWLKQHLPEPPQSHTILHGDARVGNLIVDTTGLRSILDWEAARVGADPMQDVAWPAVRMWRFGSDDTEIGGLCTRETFAAAYEAAGGTFDDARFEWWKVLGTVRWTVGLALQANSYIRGEVDSIGMLASGCRVSELEWDLLMLTRPNGAKGGQP